MKLKWVLAFDIRRRSKVTLPMQALGKNANSAEEIFILLAALVMPGLPVQHVHWKGRRMQTSSSPCHTKQVSGG